MSKHFKNSIEKFLKKGKIDTLNTQIQDSSLFWLGTGISIKSGGVKLVVWSQTSPYIIF
jgi:hypothetical protein